MISQKRFGLNSRGGRKAIISHALAVKAGRKIVKEYGVTRLTVRAVARELGVSPPSLYRYFQDHSILIDDVTADIYDELTDSLLQTLEQMDALKSTNKGARLHTLCYAFRRWAVTNPAEFYLIFQAPVQSRVPAAPNSLNTTVKSEKCVQAGMRFGSVFITAFIDVWHQYHFPIPDQQQMSASLVAQIQAYKDMLFQTQSIQDPDDLPAGVFQVLLQCWAQLYGIISLEIFKHLNYFLDDIEPFFDAIIADLGRRLAIDKGDIHES